MTRRKSTIGALLLLLAGWTSHADEEVTFSGHVAEIVHDHCADCHRPGGAAPFALLTHRDVASHADEILRAVKAGDMPPWKAVGKQGEFVGDRRLTDDQKLLIQRW